MVNTGSLFKIGSLSLALPLLGACGGSPLLGAGDGSNHLSSPGKFEVTETLQSNPCNIPGPGGSALPTTKTEVIDIENNGGTWTIGPIGARDPLDNPTGCAEANGILTCGGFFTTPGCTPNYAWEIQWTGTEMSSFTGTYTDNLVCPTGTCTTVWTLVGTRQ
jgi:hypothetical protein